MQMKLELPRVHILATGGTIAGKASSALNTSHYQAGLVPINELTSAVTGMEEIARVSAEQVLNVPSSAITPDDLLALVRRIDHIFSTDAELDGIVVTHGTDTLEESAYFAHLLVGHLRPVVFVGAMRPATAISADGPINLANAVRVAACQASQGLGTLVLMNDEIYSARDVTKTNTARLHTFRSPDLGPLGFVDGGDVSYYHSPRRRHTYASEFRLAAIEALPRVDIIYSYTGADRALVNAIVKAGARGLVLAGSGAGSIHRDALAALRELQADGIPVVRSSRTGGGRILPWPDSPEDLTADNLNPQKARILMSVALSHTSEISELRRIFGEY